MSNIVKYPFVNMQGKEARTISYEKPGEFTTLETPKKVYVRDAAEVDDELEKGFSIEDIFRIGVPVKKVGGDREEPGDGFSEGLPVTDITEEVQETIDSAKEQADKIVDDARGQADQIVIDARRQADDVRAQAHAEGYEAGHEEGLQAAEAEVSAMRQQIESERQSLQAEYDSMISELEPQFAGVVMELMEKLTGVVMRENEDVILHLIRAGLKDVRKNAERIIIRVSPDDSLIAETHKNELVEEMGGDVTIEIQPQEGMEPNECMIETDNQMLDAGIRTQLDNLTAAIRMLT
ncbi:MAG: hypothetical protein J5819_00615 [Eubacterium sp.]|nr:hypothetical protein [Eubacterium sp.]